MSQSNLTPQQREHANKRMCFWKRKQTLLKKCNEIHTTVGAEVYLAMKFHGRWHQFISSSNPAFPPSRDDLSVEYPVPSVSTPEDFASSQPSPLRGAALRAVLLSQPITNQPAHDSYSTSEFRPVHEDKPVHGLAGTGDPSGPLGEQASNVFLSDASCLDAILGVGDSDNSGGEKGSANSSSAHWATRMPHTPPTQNLDQEGDHKPPPAPGRCPSRVPQRADRLAKLSPLQTLTAGHKVIADMDGNAPQSPSATEPRQSAKSGLRRLGSPVKIRPAAKRLPSRTPHGKAHGYNQYQMALAARPAIARVLKHRKGIGYKLARRGTRRV